MQSFSGAILMREPRMAGAKWHTCICDLGTYHKNRSHICRKMDRTTVYTIRNL
jgi:hypothetical protein